MLEAIDKRLEEKKSLEEIGCELCDAVKDPKGKALRIIKNYKGKKYLVDNAEWLGYDVVKSAFGEAGGEQKAAKIFSGKEIETVTGDDGDCCVYEPIPLKEVAIICPCGCGYGYYDGKFYSSKQLEKKHV